jgi:pimeloyl-ACP methyl ester carboxylesterase
MKFQSLGDKNNPTVLFIAGMFCDANANKLFAHYFEETYYVILPTLDGHCQDKSVYLSKEDEAKKIINYLKSENITELALLQGTSMGGSVALEVYRQSISQIKINKVFIDGGTFMKFPKVVKMIMYHIFIKFIMIAHKHEGHPEEVTEEFMNMKLMKLIGGKNIEKYREMIETMAPILMYMTEESIQNICETCYGNDLPQLDDKLQKPLIFFFGEKEPAKRMLGKLMKYYPNSSFPIQKDGTHAGFQTENPKEYAKMLLNYSI